MFMTLAFFLLGCLFGANLLLFVVGIVDANRINEYYEEGYRNGLEDGRAESREKPPNTEGKMGYDI